MPFHSGCMVSMRSVEDQALYELGTFTEPTFLFLSELRVGDYVETTYGYDRIVYIERFESVSSILYPLSNVMALRCTPDVCLLYRDEWRKAGDVSQARMQVCTQAVNVYTKLYNTLIVDGVTCMQVLPIPLSAIGK